MNNEQIQRRCRRCGRLLIDEKLRVCRRCGLEIRNKTGEAGGIVCGVALTGLSGAALIKNNSDAGHDSES